MKIDTNKYIETTVGISTGKRIMIGSVPLLLLIISRNWIYRLLWGVKPNQSAGFVNEVVWFVTVLLIAYTVRMLVVVSASENGLAGIKSMFKSKWDEAYTLKTYKIMVYLPIATLFVIYISGFLLKNLEMIRTGAIMFSVCLMDIACLLQIKHEDKNSLFSGSPSGSKITVLEPKE